MKTLVDFVKKEGTWLISRLDGLKTRVSAQRVSLTDIKVDLREVGECLLLVLVSLLLYASVVLTQFAFVPIMIVAIKRGWKESLLYLTGAFALLLLLMVRNADRLPFDGGLLLFSPTHYTFEFISRALGMSGGRFLDYYLIFGILGVFLGTLVARNYRLGYVVFSGLSVYVGIVVFALSLSWLVGGFDRFMSEYALYVDEKLSAFVQAQMGRMGEYGELVPLKGIDLALIERKARIAAELYKRDVVYGFAPRGGYLLKELVVIFTGVSLVRLYFKGKFSRAALSFSLRNFRIGDDWVWAVVISWGLVYINLHLKNPLLGILSWNAAVLISLLFFLRGLSIVRVVADRIGIPVVFQYPVIVFLLFYAFILFVSIVAGIGVADTWLKIKESIDINKKRENK